MNRRLFLQGALASLVSAGMIGRYNLHDVGVDLVSLQTKQDLGLCFLQISDQHIHQNTRATGSDKVTGQIVGLINRIYEMCLSTKRQLIVLLTGDMVTCEKWGGIREETDEQYFRDTFSPLGNMLVDNGLTTYAVAGNHDRKISRTDQLLRVLQSFSIQYVHPGLIVDNKTYTVAGLPDWLTEQNCMDDKCYPLVQHRAEEQKLTLLLGHSAEVIKKLSPEDRYNTLFFAGHTHGYASRYLRMLMNYESPYELGTYNVGKQSMIQVSGGSGTTSESPWRGLYTSALPKISCFLVD